MHSPIPASDARFRDGRRPNVMVDADAAARTKAGNQFPWFAGDIEGGQTRVDLRQVVDEIEFLLSRVLPKSISVRTDMPADLRPIVGDATQISQMLLNLCINARDAMPDGGALTIAVENPPFDESPARAFGGRPKDCLRLTVSDTGHGIPADATDRVFDPSFRAKVPDDGESRWTAVLRIVRTHRGLISVQSPPEGGASVMVDLPVYSVKPTLLIAEADAGLRDAYHLICSARGFDVQTSDNGVDCLNKLGEALPQALIVDLDIPWGGGDGVLACLRQRFVDSSRPFVIVTGVDAHREISQRTGVPSRCCFAKPFRMSAVLDLISRELAGTSHTYGGDGQATRTAVF